MTSPLNSRLLQLMRCRRQAHINSITMATWLPRTTVTRLQNVCPLARTLMKNSCDSNSSQDTCPWHRNLQKKVTCQSNLQQINSSQIIRDSTQRAVGNTVSGFNLVPTRWFHYQTALMAGHSKWANIKHAKGARDQERSLMFMKYSKMIKQAVKEGGSTNPELNNQLAFWIKVARSKAFSKASIENAIKTASKAAPDVSQLYELKGPGNTVFVVDILTESPNRARQEITKILKNSGISIQKPGSTSYAFEKKGVVRAKGQPEKDDQPPLTLDLATEVAIEVEAEDVDETVNEEDEAVFMFICEPNQVKSVKDGLTSQSYTVESAGLEYIAVKDFQVDLSDDYLEKVSKVIQSVEEHPDVVKVYDNIV